MKSPCSGWLDGVSQHADALMAQATTDESTQMAACCADRDRPPGTLPRVCCSNVMTTVDLMTLQKNAGGGGTFRSASADIKKSPKRHEFKACG